MLANNKQSLTLFLAMHNKYDYREFVTLCNAAGIVPVEWLEYAQKAQSVMDGMEKYPDLPAHEAYLKFVKEDNGGFASKPIPDQSSRADCGNCGGGEVR